MKKAIIIICVFLIVAGIGTGIFFGATPVGKQIMTGYHYDMEKAGENNYQNRKNVEETLRSFYASYKTDKLSYEQYKDSTDDYYKNLALSYRQRANATAITYNEYFTKNSFVFKNNIPSDLPQYLETI